MESRPKSTTHLEALECEVRHGTTAPSAESILEQGFRPSRAAGRKAPPWYGEGAYFFKHDNFENNAQTWAEDCAEKSDDPCDGAVISARFASAAVFSIADKESDHYLRFFNLYKQIEADVRFEKPNYENFERYVTYLVAERLKNDNPNIEAICYLDSSNDPDIPEYHGLVVSEPIESCVSNLQLVS